MAPARYNGDRTPRHLASGRCAITKRTVELTCPPSLTADFERCANRHVVVEGIATLDASSAVTRIDVTGVEPTAIDDAFWRPRSVEDLAQEQGVEPFQFPSPGDPAPDPFDVDEFLAAIFDRAASSQPDSPA